MTAEEIVFCKKAHVWQNYTPISLKIAYVENDSEHNLAFGAVFENDIGNSGAMWINCHCTLIRRSSSKDRLYGNNAVKGESGGINGCSERNELRAVR